MIKEAYVNFETAKLLKEKGFDGECDLFGRTDESGRIIYEASKIAYNQGIDDECIILPTQQTAMKWLREVHKLYITISHRFSHNADQDVCFNYYINIDEAEDGEYMTYEQATEAAIKYCLEHLI